MLESMLQNSLQGIFRNLEDLYRISTGKIIGIKQMGEKIAPSLVTFFGDEKKSAHP